jgi:hypothetical protein
MLNAEAADLNSLLGFNAVQQEMHIYSPTTFELSSCDKKKANLRACEPSILPYMKPFDLPTKAGSSTIGVYFACMLRGTDPSIRLYDN